MSLQHEINARVDVAGERVHRGGHLFAGGDHRAKPLLQRLLEIAQPGEPQRLYGADHRGIRGFQYGGNLHGGLLHHRFAVVMDIACDLQQTRRQLMRPRAKAVAIDIHAPLLFADHREASGSGRPAICDCTCAAISPKDANEFEIASSREIST